MAGGSSRGARHRSQSPALPVQLEKPARQLPRCFRTSFMFALLGTVAALPLSLLLEMRDEALLMAYPAPPVPPYGRVFTVNHGATTMARVAERAPALIFSPTADLYYEAQTTNCNPSKNFVMLGGANGASFQYWDVITHFRQRGWAKHF